MIFGGWGELAACTLQPKFMDLYHVVRDVRTNTDNKLLICHHTRVEMEKEAYMYGPVGMVVKKMTVIATVTQPVCGQYQ